MLFAMSKWLLSASTVIGFAALCGSADANCTCRYAGKNFEQGQTVCIRVGDASRMARCDMALNNSSWTFLKEGCPSALIVPSTLRSKTIGTMVSLSGPR